MPDDLAGLEEEFRQLLLHQQPCSACNHMRVAHEVLIGGAEFVADGACTRKGCPCVAFVDALQHCDNPECGHRRNRHWSLNIGLSGCQGNHLGGMERCDCEEFIPSVSELAGVDDDATLATAQIFQRPWYVRAWRWVVGGKVPGRRRSNTSGRTPLQ